MDARTADRPVSAWTPLAGNPAFAMLWGVWVVANVCMWMNDVAAAWLMTSLSASPVMVALVQSASTLPVFLLGVPSGALADIVDRKRYFMATQVWVGAVGTLVGVVVAAGAVNAPLLLLLTFLNGVGLAMRWPVFAAIVPELVPRAHLPAALALNGVAMNASRIVGPILAGAIIAAAGSAWVFALNALLSVGAAVAIGRWRREEKVRALPAERFLGAMRVGLQHVRQSRRMHAVLLRVAVFFLQSMAMLALLPLVAKGLHGGGAATFTVLLACMGAGAVVSALFLPRLRGVASRDGLVVGGTLLQAGAMLALSLAPNAAVAGAAMVVGGGAWITAANSLTVSAQLALPDWVRARGMSIYQMALMGASAAGAALWGQVATWTDVRTSLLCAAVGAVVAVALTRRWRLESGVVPEDLTPANFVPPGAADVALEPQDGPVLITIEYRIDPACTAQFIEVMQESRRNRLRLGVLSWGLFRDASDPGRYVEHFVDESWLEHLRHFERLTANDIALRERRLAFHIDQQPPRICRYVGQAVDR